MKKIISILLVMTVILNLAGCTANKKAAEEEAVRLADEYYSELFDVMEDYYYAEYGSLLTLFNAEPTVDDVKVSGNKYKVLGSIAGGGTIIGEDITPVTLIAGFEVELELNEDGTFEVIDYDYQMPDVV